MSGPHADTGELFTWMRAETSLWPLSLWTVNGECHVECDRCEDGTLLVAGDRGRPFMLADLVAIIERHAVLCTGASVDL